MRAVVQRVDRAVVMSRPGLDEEYEVVGSIGPGLAVFVGVTHADTSDVADKLADKLWGLRIFDDKDGVMNVATSDAVGCDGAELLVVSQFTLYGDTSRGRRPSWIAAAQPDLAEPLIDRVVERLRSRGAEVATGRFRTDMKVELVNDGPATLVVEV